MYMSMHMLAIVLNSGQKIEHVFILGTWMTPAGVYIQCIYIFHIFIFYNVILIMEKML